MRAGGGAFREELAFCRLVFHHDFRAGKSQIELHMKRRTALAMMVGCLDHHPARA
jgi:hypothetical protein